jgi:16S rRNA (adenine1518-N6/adenine1519-N6)-dimethyltransferase
MALLGAREVRELADAIGLRPSKQRGQNFVHDANTVRRIVALAGVGADDTVLEVGPGLGSLTLGLLETGAQVVAIEIDPALAGLLPQTVASRMPDAAPRLTVLEADALRVTELPGVPGAAATNTSHPDAPGVAGFPADALPDSPDTALADVTGAEGAEVQVLSRAPALPNVVVANLPYNVSVPVILHLLATFDSIEHGLVLVQAEVAERLVAAPGSKVYGVPSAKLAWYASSKLAGSVPPQVFWPIPHVESKLVEFTRTDPPKTVASREQVFQIVDRAFASRRKMLRSAFTGVVDDAEAALTAAGVSPTARGETLSIADFARVAEQVFR